MALKRSRSSSARFARLSRPVQRRHRVHQSGAAAQPGQGIAGDRRPLSLRVGDVAEKAQTVGRHVLLGDDAGAQFQPAPASARTRHAEFQPEGLAGLIAEQSRARRDRSARSSGWSRADPVGMRQGGFVRRKPRQQGRIRRQGQKLGAEIQIEHALMRRADRRQSQIGEGRGRIERLFGPILRFQQPGGVGTVQERQHRDFLAGDHRQRQKHRARRREAAGGGRARSESRPSPPRLVTAAASATSAKAAALGAITCAACMPRRPQTEQIERRRRRCPARSAMSVSKRGARHAQIGQRSQPAKAIKRASGNASAWRGMTSRNGTMASASRAPAARARAVRQAP